uniref:Uncharacterized protein n=1 Tax=Bracon brevicornis TaxID=1563983 RepID=A0A6V7KSF6_9HYME
MKKSREQLLNIPQSFIPDIISESEERERIASLAQRDFLIKSHGILEEIYLAMKKNGTLRPGDIKKYSSYGKLARRLDLYQNSGEQT